METSQLIREQRQEAKFSMRDVAQASGLAPSTISRIESGTITDPTIQTVEAILAGMGQIMRVETIRTLRYYSHALDRFGEPDFMALSNWADGIHKRPWETELAISLGPRPDTEPRLANLLAAMAEKSADDQALQRPAWCQEIESLLDPYESGGTAQHRVRARAQAPRQFVDRNIFLSATNIWRRRDDSDE